MPNGLEDSMSPARRDIFLSVVSTFTNFSLSIHASIRDWVTRNRILYHLPCSAFRNFVVSFSDASWPSRLDIPTSEPPQPPTINVQKESATGTVKPQKKSEPVTRIASSATS